MGIFQEISKTIGNIADHYVDSKRFDRSDNSETEDNSESTSTIRNNCVILSTLEFPHGSLYHADRQIALKNAVTELKSLGIHVRHAVL